MSTGALAVALEREHREIDEGIQAFLAGHAEGQPRTEPLRQAIDALRRHIFLEEEFLFPPLRDAGLVAPIFVMLREHGEIWDTLDALDAQLALNPRAAAMFEICRTPLAQLERHNSKEEPVVYPQADAVLTTTARASLTSFLATGRMTDGWVCARGGVIGRRKHQLKLGAARAPAAARSGLRRRALSLRLRGSVTGEPRA